MNTQIIVAVSFCVIAVIVSYLVKYLTDKKIKKTYSSFAEKHNLNFTFESFLFKKRPEIRGEFEGVQIYICNKSDGALEASKRYYFTQAEILAPKFNLDFNMSNENILKKIGKSLGYEDVIVGVHELDKNYVFQTNQPEEFVKLFYSMDHQLFDKSNFGKQIWYENGKFICKYKGVAKKEKDLAKIEGMLKICTAMLKAKS